MIPTIGVGIRTCFCGRKSSRSGTWREFSISRHYI